MKNQHFFGAIAIALLISLNASIFLESNNWDNTATEQAHATTSTITPVPIASYYHWQEFGLPCITRAGWPGIKVTCVPAPFLSCTPAACS